MLTNLRKLNELPTTLNKGAVDRALDSFIHDSHLLSEGVEESGARQALCDSIAASVIFKNSPDSFVWLAEEAGEVVGFALTQTRLGVDNALCYWMTHAWVAKPHRFKPYVKEWFQGMKAHAKTLQCSHILIPSSRGSRAYCRFLGGGFHEYLTILKEDI